MEQVDMDTAVDPLWYKDAVIYELHVKTFCDSDGDGMGDFRGLVERLDYLQELGVTAIWLLPFYPSPMRDDGYDIADYFDVNPNFGTLDDFRSFLDAAHQRNLRVITELVINHTSDQNPWFQKSRRAVARHGVVAAGANGGSAEGTSGAAEAAYRDDDLAYKDYYVWSETPEKYKHARIIFKDFETSNWAWDPVAKAYYWHRFYSHQPDLNFDNPAVHGAVKKVCDFWLSMGVDGLRLDAIPYLYEREDTNCGRRSRHRGDEVLDGHGRRWDAPRCDSLSMRARRHEQRESSRDPRVSPRTSDARRRELSESHAAFRGEPVAGGCSCLFWERG